MLKVRAENGYKDIEQVYSGSTEIDKIFDKHGNVLFAVNKELEGVPSLTYKGKEETDLKNYRIYGNTVNGESVGDRTGNLFDGTFIHRSVIGAEVSDNEPNRRSIVVDISNFNNGDKITFSRETSAGNSFQMYQVSSPLKGGRLLNASVISGNSKTLLATITLDDISNYHYLMIFLNGATNTITDEELLASKIMVNVGNTPLPYEPYGYRVPVSVTNGTDTETTNIYLPEQIKMVGDEAEYVDYGQQKQHRVRKNLLQNTVTSRTIDGITFTVNADKSITCNGTATNTIFFVVKVDIVLESGAYVLTGCPLGGGQNTFRLYAQTSYGTIFYIDDGAGAIINYTSKIKVLIAIYSGQVCNNLIFYPMIRKADIEDDTYEPYIEDTEVNVTIPALPTLSGTNTLSVGTEVQPSNVYLKGRIKEGSI